MEISDLLLARYPSPNLFFVFQKVEFAKNKINTINAQNF